MILTHKIKQVRYVAILIAIALFNLTLALTRGYLIEWNAFRTPLLNFYRPPSLFEKLLELQLLVIPGMFFIWMFWVSREKKRIKKLAIYLGSIILYILAYGISILLVSQCIDNCLKLDNSPFFRNTSFALTFVIITTIWNYFIARIEGQRLSRKNLLLLMISCSVIPLFRIGWASLLQLFISGSFADNGTVNGGFGFAFILYEGIYYLWLKQHDGSIR